MEKLNYDGMNFCGTVETTGFAAGQCKWNKKTITWTIVGFLQEFSKNELIDAYKLAFSYWEEVCNIKAVYVDDGAAMIKMGSGHIDRPGKVLAWSEMPCGNVSSVRQKYDTNEIWVIAQNPPSNRIDIVRVACHEIGHALGIPHIESGNLMQPSYSRGIRKPQKGDIREAQSRYGKPEIKPTPTPYPDKPTVDWWQFIKDMFNAFLRSLFK